LWLFCNNFFNNLRLFSHSFRFLVSHLYCDLTHYLCFFLQINSLFQSPLLKRVKYAYIRRRMVKKEEKRAILIFLQIILRINTEKYTL
jgi:hypothetical protein